MTWTRVYQDLPGRQWTREDLIALGLIVPVDVRILAAHGGRSLRLLPGERERFEREARAQFLAQGGSDVQFN